MSLNPLKILKSFSGNVQNQYISKSTSWGSNFDKTKADKTNQIVQNLDDYYNTITNALGTRSPLYTIGQVPKESSLVSNAMKSLGLSKYATTVENATQSFTRAIGSFAPTQDGVIIDGIGDVNAKIDMELPTNPVLYRSNNVIDTRVRNPNSVTMAILVSNYNSDDALASVLNTIIGSGTDWLSNTARNLLSNNGNTRAQEALYKLRWIQENGMPFTVYTPHGIYQNMLIKSISPTTNPSTMDMLFAEIEFTEVILYKALGDTSKTPIRSNLSDPSTSTSSWAKKQLTKVLSYGT